MAEPVISSVPIDQQKWASPIEADQGPIGTPMDIANGDGPHAERSERSSSAAPPIAGSKPGTIYREKQIKANKVYIGGLPEHTRQEDLQNCFSKAGNIVSIELKLGYGFVEFDTREAAEEAVSKFHDGFFMGNKIRVELSHGGGKSAKFGGEPGACFKCGQHGHWARECPNHVVAVDHRGRRGGHDSLLHRISQPTQHASRDGLPPPPTREPGIYRDEPPRPAGYDRRSSYDFPQNRDYPRDYRPYRDARPPSPPRDYRDYRDYPGGGPPPVTRSRDYDDYRRDYRGPPPPPTARYEGGRPAYPGQEYDYPPPPRDGPPSGFTRPPYGAPPVPPRDAYERPPYDKRSGPPAAMDRYPSGYPPVPRPRSPPRGPPREDFDRHPREYPPPGEFRGRHSPPPRIGSPPRYPPEQGPPRYRRRSQSPAARPPNGTYRGGYPNDQGPPADNPSGMPGYGPGSGAPYPPGNYNGPPNGYRTPPGGSGNAGQVPRPSPSGRGGISTGGPGSRSGRDERDYPPARAPERNGRDVPDSNAGPGGPNGGGYVRR